MVWFRKKRHSRLLREFAETVAMTAVVFAFLVSFVVQGYRVDGKCMEPNLVTGERVIGNKFVYRVDRPDRGDVIVFKYPLDPHKTFIKRIVGLPGENIEIRDWKVYIDDRELKEGYVKNVPHEQMFRNLSRQKIPQGYLFVLGDNRDQSNDSRSWGDLPLENIQAKAWFRYWPLSRTEVFR